MHEAVGPGARDVLVWLGSAANLGHDLIGRAWMVGPGRHGAQHQAGERDVKAEAHGRSIHEARVNERVRSFVYWGWRARTSALAKGGHRLGVRKHCPEPRARAGRGCDVVGRA